MKLKSAVHWVLATAAVVGSGALTPAMAQDAVMLEEVIVTAQKREESLQKVPIAVSAFSSDALQAQKMDGAKDLQFGVPNMNYTRSNFGGDAGYGGENFQIRGIGAHVIGVSGDSGVGVHENNTPMAVSRLSDVDFYDVERVEVLRGPQGTLYGRNSTGGVVNVITAKPKNDFGAGITLDGGNYANKKVSAFVNVPMGESLALRIAGMGLKRDGYTTDVTSGDDVDGRSLYSIRTTLAFTPMDNFKVNLLWEHFREDDNRFGGGKVLCVKDPGPTSIGGVATNALTRMLESQGCIQSALSNPAARSGTVNSVATLGGVVSLAFLPPALNFLPGDVYAGQTQSPNLRSVQLSREPIYEAEDDFAQLGLDWDLTETLKLTSLTAFLRDSVYGSADGNSYQPSVNFADTPITPGGVAQQAQIGASNQLLSINTNDFYTRQWTEELRLQSNFDGALNFNVGGIYVHLRRLNQVYVIVNSETVVAPLLGSYVDPLPTPDTTGHNYFLSYQPYELRAKAAFGELYWQAMERLKFTFGLRYTNDQKQNINYPVSLFAPGRGWPFTNASGVQTIKDQYVEFKETTGRLNANWQINDDMLLYASYSKGYKGGGFNSPDIIAGAASYRPEFVNAFEVGSKNAFFGRSLNLNVTAFHYDYKDYQISKINGFSAVTDNVDAEVNGVELESVWLPVRNLRLNANVGWLETEIKTGSAIDPANRNQSDPSLAIAKSLNGACVVNAQALGAIINQVNLGNITPLQLLGGVCAGAFAGAPFNAVPSDGVSVNLAGRELPSSPHLNASVDAQYEWSLTGNWTTTIRGDYYHQSDAYTSMFNNWSDRLDGYSNVNATITFNNVDAGLRVQLYGRNLTDNEVIISAPTQSDALGLVRAATVTDPRLFGLAVTKTF